MNRGFKAMVLTPRFVMKTFIVATTEKALQNESGEKSMLIDYERLRHHKCVPEGQIINKEYYLKIMKKCRNVVRRKARILGKR